MANDVKQTLASLKQTTATLNETLKHLNTTATAWEVNLKTSIELYTIWEMTGVLDQLETIDENLFDVITDIMDEKRDDWEDFLDEMEDEDDDD